MDAAGCSPATSAGGVSVVSVPAGTSIVIPGSATMQLPENKNARFGAYIGSKTGAKLRLR
mgnify:CR=1 FL=1